MSLHGWTLPQGLAVHWIDDRRDRRMGELIGCVWLLAAADLGFTLWAHHYTAFLELNPIARQLLQANALTLLVTFKVASTGLGTGIFWRLRRSGRAEMVMWGLVVVYVLLTLRWSHYIAGLPLTPGV
jgi:hypothetical protein